MLKRCQILQLTRGLKTKVSKIEGQNVRIRSKKSNAWISTIGLEVHAQLQTKTKLFSRSLAAFGNSANTQVSLFDASTPGTLPVINKKAVELALKAALALNCQINEVSTFDRKHYFYADLPAGYQITQQRRPLAVKGHLKCNVLKSSTVSETYVKKADIIQLQIEQDSGKSLHDEIGNVTLVDLNRCGQGLIEIVFGPDLFHGEEAASLVKELILILQRLEACNCQMDSGALRIDANISIRPFGTDVLGTRAEVKNINSIRGLVNAIEYEVDRQIEILENGGIIENETRNYDGNTKKTVSMRDKEVKQDYRFMPEPNLPPLRLDLNFGGKPETENNPNILNVKHYQDNLPELPEKTRQKVVDEFGLGFELVVRLVNEPELLELFLDAQNCGEKILCQTRLAHLLLLDVVEICSKHLKPMKNCINPEFLVTATNMKFKDEITSRIINNAFECVILGENHDSFMDLLNSKGWLKVFRDDQLIGQLVMIVLEANTKIVKKFVKSGNKKILQELTQEVLNHEPILDGAYVKEFISKRLKDYK